MALEWARLTAPARTDGALVAELALAGYRHLRATQDRAAKIAAYTEITADADRSGEIEAAVSASVSAGLL